MSIRLEMKIDKDYGRLWICRVGLWIKQWCKHRPDVWCSDSCPDFHEPEDAGFDYNDRCAAVQIELCDGNVLTGSMIDERTNKTRKTRKGYNE